MINLVWKFFVLTFWVPSIKNICSSLGILQSVIFLFLRALMRYMFSFIVETAT